MKWTSCTFLVASSFVLRFSDPMLTVWRLHVFDLKSVLCLCKRVRFSPASNTKGYLRQILSLCRKSPRGCFRLWDCLAGISLCSIPHWYECGGCNLRTGWSCLGAFKKQVQDRHSWDLSEVSLEKTGSRFCFSAFLSFIGFQDCLSLNLGSLLPTCLFAFLSDSNRENHEVKHNDYSLVTHWVICVFWVFFFFFFNLSRNDAIYTISDVKRLLFCNPQHGMLQSQYNSLVTLNCKKTRNKKILTS